MELYAGVDLHSNNNYVGIMDKEGKRVYKKKLPNDISVITSGFQPYRDDLAGIAIESTYNWYW